MGDLFEKNLEHLRTRYPELAERVAALEPSPRYGVVPTPSGLLDLSVEGAAGPLFAGAPDPLAAARAHWASKPLRNPALMVFLGLDFGYQLAAYLSNPNPNTLAYILIEKDLQIFRRLLGVLDISSFVRDLRVHLVVGVEEKELFLRLRPVLQFDMIHTLIRATHFTEYSYSYRLHAAYYKAAMTAIRDCAVDLYSDIGNSPLDAFVGIRHMLLNLETIAREPGVTSLFGRFKGRPAVIVATGPSLDKNYRLLPELQNRALIFSVDASLKFLLRNGVRPHVVTCLERVPETVPFFDGIPAEECARTLLVSVPVVVPEAYRAYAGPKAIMYRPAAQFDWLENPKGTLSTGHSSANMAFKLAETLGCNPIVLVGQDLAYADEGHTHSAAAYLGKNQATFAKDKVPTLRVKGNTREWVWTNRTWHLFLTAYVKDVSSYDGTVLNATEGGAYIEGTEVTTLKEVVDHRLGPEFGPSDELFGCLVRPGAEEAEGFLARIRAEKIPETLLCLRRAAEKYRRTAARIEKTLAKGARGKQVESVLTDAFRLWRDHIREDEKLYVAAIPVVQSAYIRAMSEFFDIPNRYDHADVIHQRRLELLKRVLEMNVFSFEKLLQLYARPEDTVPLDFRKILG